MASAPRTFGAPPRTKGQLRTAGVWHTHYGPMRVCPNRACWTHFSTYETCPQCYTPTRTIREHRKRRQQP